MTKSVSRAQFLRGDFGGNRQAFRPPWAVAEADFVEMCNRCGDCLPACPEKILEKGRGGFPLVNFSLGECTFCGECVKVCKSKALRQTEGEQPWALKARIAASCLALNQVVCRSCGESCPTSAIRFRVATGAVARPEIDPVACTGCGACVGPCPVAAVTIAEPDARLAA